MVGLRLVVAGCALLTAQLAVAEDGWHSLFDGVSSKG
jgi:hypothetical protein